LHALSCAAHVFADHYVTPDAARQASAALDLEMKRPARLLNHPINHPLLTISLEAGS
jgi:hypothetical protein